MPIDISILVPDISAPSLGAAVRLRDMLAPYSVEIIGPDFGRGVCSLYREAGPFKVVSGGRMYRLPDYWWDSQAVDRAVEGRVVIAVKAFMNTVPIALRLRAQGKKAIVYLDEWDGSVHAGQSRLSRAVKLVRSLHHPLDDAYYEHVEAMIPRADTVLSTTTFLQKKFGGLVIRMGVDTKRFRPQPRDQVEALKKLLELAGKKVIVFGGVVRPHKGVEEILEALAALGRDDIRLLIVGPLTEHLQAMVKSPLYGRFLVIAGDDVDSPSGLNAEIHQKMPLYLDVGDLVVLPLRDTPLAQSQMPIKIFEALAMGKPVIGTAVSDLPAMLEGCGWVVPPGDPGALSQAIAHAVDHPAEAAGKGQAAREKSVREFSAEICGARLKGILQGLIALDGED